MTNEHPKRPAYTYADARIDWKLYYLSCGELERKDVVPDLIGYLVRLAQSSAADGMRRTQNTPAFAGVTGEEA